MKFNLLSSSLSIYYLLSLSNDYVNAHVKLYYSPSNLAIRNALTTTSDGTFSTAGACGGRDSWGPLANASPGVVGSVVCGRINYNGGHQPDPNNAFRAVFACDRATVVQTTQAQLQAKTPMTLETGSGPTVDATGTKVPAIEGNVVTQGYTLCIKIPTQGLDSTSPLNAPERRCTLSVLDQRNWGGCIDFIVSNDDGTLPEGVSTPSPTIASASTLNANANLIVKPTEEGTYRSPQQCSQSGGKCCPYSYIALKSGTRYASIRLLGLDASCYDLFAASKGNPALGYNYQVVLEPHPLEAGSLVAYIDVNLGGGTEVQKLEILVRDPSKNGITVTNISPNSPLIADFTAGPFKTLTEGVGQQMVYEPVGPYGPDMLAFIIIVVVLGVYIIGGILYGRHKTGEFKHIHSDFWMGCCSRVTKKLGSKATALKSSNGKSIPDGPLPDGWKEAKDKDGDIYYYNKALNKTQWDRPKA